MHILEKNQSIQTSVLFDENFPYINCSTKSKNVVHKNTIQKSSSSLMKLRNKFKRTRAKYILARVYTFNKVI